MTNDVEVVAAYTRALVITARVGRAAARMRDPDAVQMMDDATAVLVARARTEGVSWQAIGEALGLDALAASRRFDT